MYKLETNELTVNQIYKLLSGTVVPRSISLVSTKNEINGVNIAPFSFFNIVSRDPAIISISFMRNDGRQKDTARNILREKEAVVHIVDEDNLEDANQAAAILPYGESELDRTNFTLVDSTNISTQGIKEAKIRYEAKLYDHIEIKNKKGETTTDLILLEINTIHLSENIYDEKRGYININELKPVGRLAGNNYTKLGEQFSVIRPR